MLLIADSLTGHVTLSKTRNLVVLSIMCIIIYMDFLGGSVLKEAACNAGDTGLIFGLGRSPEEGNGYSSILAWEIPWTEESGGFMGL